MQELAGYYQELTNIVMAIERNSVVKSFNRRASSIWETISGRATKNPTSAKYLIELSQTEWEKLYDFFASARDVDLCDRSKDCNYVSDVMQIKIKEELLSKF
jgi:hypothetical protein